MARKGILGKKVGMTQVFTDNGELVPVTVIDVTPNVVMQVKTVESDGYEAVQLGYGDMREVLTNKPSVGHAKKADTTPKRFVREIRDVALSDYEVGSEVKAELTNSQQATLWTSPVLPKVMVIKVISRKMVSPAALWHTVLATIVVQVHLELSSTKSSRVRNFLAGWVTIPAPCKTCKSLPPIQNTMSC